MSLAPAPTPRLTVTRDTLLAHARALPSAPQVMSGLYELLQDINTDLDQIASEIRLEPALAARVIRISNSPVFGGQRVGSVDEAVNRVGFGEVLRLVGAATVAGLVDRSLACYGIPAERLRECLLLHALAAEALAGATEIDPRTAYSAGLLRGVGMMILDRAGRGKLDPAAAFDPRSFERYDAWEHARFGLVATDVTATVLDDWKFPAEVVNAVQEHLLATESGFADPFACTLHLAGVIVARQGFALPGEEKVWQFSPAILSGAGLDEEQFEAAATQAASLFERHRAAL